MALQLSLRDTLHDVAMLFFPEHCCVCGAPLVGERGGLCIHCQLHMVMTDAASRKDNPTEMRLAGRIPFAAAMSLLIFTHDNQTRKLLHQIKYQDNMQLAHYLGYMMGEELQQSSRFRDVEVLVPVPLHRRKLRQRGYNQSLELCRGIARAMPLPIQSHCLTKTVYTTSQTHKNREERQQNMLNTFTIRHPKRLQGKHILLVDDTLTTGATIEACWMALQEVPDIRISIATLAIAGTT